MRKAGVSLDDNEEYNLPSPSKSLRCTDLQILNCTKKAPVKESFRDWRTWPCSDAWAKHYAEVSKTSQNTVKPEPITGMTKLGSLME